MSLFRRRAGWGPIVAISVALVTATATPAVAARPSPTTAVELPPLPPLSPQHLHDVIAGLPDADTTGAIVQIHGSAGCWSGASGIADLSTGEPVGADGRFRIGSMTKTFTAVTALQLAAEHRLNLDGTVQHYLPGLLPASYPPITVRQVLTFTSGLNHVEVPSKDVGWFLAHRFDRWAPGSQLDTARPLAFAPGTRQRYGNIDYIVAGLLIEKVSGHTWAEEVRRRIIAPLGLSATSIPGRSTTITGPHAHGYESTLEGMVDVTDADMSLQWSAASIISAAPDLDRFLVALFSGRLVRGQLLAEMFTVPQVPTDDGDDDPADDEPAHYSAGLTRIPVGPLVLWGKSGDRPGYNNGMGSTRDLSRRLVFSVNDTHMGGEQPLLSQRIIAASFLGP